ncbi:MAG: phage portal protein [Clostridia bacterium]|nr:phage portal protein [Clostridia bacterium]
MTIDEAKQMIKKYAPEISPVILKEMTARRYYDMQNDVLFQKENKNTEETPLRTADNRVPSAFFPLLVDQKAAYMFSYPPLFDTGYEDTDKQIAEVLGDGFPRICKRLCKAASFAGIAWLHYWTDGRGGFRYTVIPGAQVSPVYTQEADGALQYAVRMYETVLDGEGCIVYEIWDDTECHAFMRAARDSVDDGLRLYPMFAAPYDAGGRVNIYRHGFGRPPFIPFANNDRQASDLERVKGLIDTYDKTYNGFANDLEDIQEVIMVLSGYSGTDLAGFLENLKKYKTVKIDDGEGGVSTLNIDIPVEAREKMLSITEKAIFTQGQGVNPDPQRFGNASGVALKFLYSLLELKAGDMQTEFSAGFSVLVRAICAHLGLPCSSTVGQTWTRNCVRNDEELASIAVQSVGLLSKDTILRNHPFVENILTETEKLEREGKY